MDELLENVDYRFEIAEDNSTSVNVVLLSGDYVGVKYRYGSVSVSTDETSGDAYLNFKFDIIDDNSFVDLEDDIAFKTRIGDVLTSIMLKDISGKVEV